MNDAEKQRIRFIARVGLKQRALIRVIHRALPRRLPTAHELAYDNDNFFVIGYSPSDAILSVVAGSNSVCLCFIHGKGLPDPNKLLLGSGEQCKCISTPVSG